LTTTDAAIAAARQRLAALALEVARESGTVVTASALVHLGLQLLLLETHSRDEVLKWWQHQARLIERSDLGKPSGRA
jgi:hypothetical protein